MNIIHYEYTQISQFRRVYYVKNTLVRGYAFRQGDLLYFKKNAFDYIVIAVDDVICIV